MNACMRASVAHTLHASDCMCVPLHAELSVLQCVCHLTLTGESASRRSLLSSVSLFVLFMLLTCWLLCTLQGSRLGQCESLP